MKEMTSATSVANLWVASAKGDIAYVKLVVSQHDPGSLSALLSSRNPAGHTPLTLACLNAQITTATFLLDKGPASLEVATADGKSPLTCAAVSGSLSLMLMIIAKGGNLWHICPDGMSIFYLYARGAENALVTTEGAKLKQKAFKEMKRAREKFVNAEIAKSAASGSSICQRCLRGEWELKQNERAFITCRCSDSGTFRRFCCDDCRDADWLSGHWRSCFKLHHPSHSELRERAPIQQDLGRT